MKKMEINSHQLLLEKGLEPLSKASIEELKRMEELDVSGFSEADVRAEIIDPILRTLGYRKGQDYSVDREKHIRFLGKTSRYIDYNLTLWEKNFWLIEAKKPMPLKPEFGYEELSQAVEYAAHPNIDAALVVLCDGLKLEVFDREQDLERPLLRIIISDLTKQFEELRKLLCPIQIWFFYRRKIIRAIDRVFDHEGNQNRVNEFKQLVEFRLNEKRSQTLDNFRKMKLSNDNGYCDHLSDASIDEIIDVHFFISQSFHCIAAMTENLLSDCTVRSSFHVLYKVFPDEPRDTNDNFYMHAMDLLIRLQQKNVKVSWLPSWLVGNDRDNIKYAIQQLVKLCLTHFTDDPPRKTILLAANAYRRIFKILAVLFPHQKQLAEFQHLVTRYSGPEFCWEQVLSSRERNMIIGWDRLSLLAIAKFVKQFSTENHKFNINLARQELKEMWMFEKQILTATPNYRQLLQEMDLGEVHSTEASGVVYDSLGHGCLCLIEKYPEWTNYILNNHHVEVETLANIGSWAARKLLGEDIKAPSQIQRKIHSQLLAERFFFGDLNTLNVIAKAYGHET
ncbi:MAG: hypothetical protein ACYDIB_10995 [Desulfobulbia bacterium]